MDNYLDEITNPQTPIYGYDELVYRTRHNSTLATDEPIINYSFNSKYDFRTFFSISPTRIVKYVRNIKPDDRDYTFELIAKGWSMQDDGTMKKPAEPIQLTKSTEHHGLMSTKANGKIMKCIDWLLFNAKEKETLNPKFGTTWKWKANFITLSLPSKQKHSDTFITNKMLQNFLIYACRTHGVNDYLWRKETQSNGNVHFHIVTDAFIPWLWLRDCWNNILRNYDYIQQFERDHKHRTPNSTDIHSLKKVKNIAHYLGKYCGKNSKGITVLLTLAGTKQPLNIPYKPGPFKYNFKGKKFFRQCYGRLWGCSQNLSKLCKIKFMATDKLEKEMCVAESNFPQFRSIYDYVSIFKIQLQNYALFGLNSLAVKVNKLVNEILKPDIPILSV